jgi:hypothetical protein
MEMIMKMKTFGGFGLGRSIENLRKIEPFTGRRKMEEGGFMLPVIICVFGTLAGKHLLCI